MKSHLQIANLFSSRIGILLLASAIAVPVWAQQGQPAADDSQNTPPAVAQQQSFPDASAMPAPPKEGFWGRINPFARKKWVKKQIDPINDRLTELDEVDAKNARDIRDVNARAEAGIQKAQSTADAANQTALTAGTEAQGANATAQQASKQVNQLNSTVNGLDQYRQVSDLNVAFRAGSPMLSTAARRQLDDLAAGLTGRDGYILEMDAHSPAAGSAGIQSSERLAEAVERYLVTEHQIPVYRMHFVALGNARETVADSDSPAPRVRTSSVHIRLMENSLAAQAAAPPQGSAASAGTEQP